MILFQLPFLNDPKEKDNVFVPSELAFLGVCSWDIQNNGIVSYHYPPLRGACVV